MEEELKCPYCRQFFKEPILLQCAHGCCRQCALKAQHKISTNTGNFPLGNQHQADTISLCVSDDQDSDKLSVVSETDSGVVICSNTSGTSLGAASANSSGASSRGNFWFVFPKIFCKNFWGSRCNNSEIKISKRFWDNFVPMLIFHFYNSMIWIAGLLLLSACFWHP